MSREEREAVLAEVDGVRWGKRRQLGILGIPKSTYYRWRQQAHGAGERHWRRPWNRLTAEEEATVLAVAREMPEWRSRQLAYGEAYQGRQTPIVYTPTTSEDLYFTVDDRNRRSTGSYTLSISVPSDDHGNSSSKATAVEVSSSVEGVIDYVGDLDYFSFQAEADTTYVIATSLGTLDYTYLYLYSSSGQQLAYGEAYQGRQTPIVYTPTTSEDLYFTVDDRNRRSTGSYTIGILVLVAGD